jgi:hypothetical protein
MNKRRRRQQAQLHLPHSRIHLPAWNSLPESCRDEVVALLAKFLILRRHAKPKAGAGARGGSDE